MNEINYYKINEVLENRYYQIPQELFVNPLYKDNLNSDSKILYGFLLDRLTLSQKNHWYDNDKNIYLIFTRQEVQEKLCLSEKTATKAFKQLIEVCLIKEKRQGLGKPNLIYVGKIQHEEILTDNEDTDTEKVQVLNRKIYGSGTIENTVLDGEILPTINPNNIKPNITNTNSINPQSEEESISLNKIKEQCKLNEFTKEEQCVLEDVLNTLYDSPNLKVGAVTITNSKILSKLELIKKDNLFQLVDIIKNSSNIKNLTSYLMICLYNNLGNSNIVRKSTTIDKYNGREYSEEFLNQLYANMSMEKVFTTA